MARIVGIGTTQGASCFGPAYKYLMTCNFRKGISEPFYEKMMLKLMGVVRLK